MLAVGTDRFRNVRNTVGRNLRHKDFASMGVFDCPQNEIDPISESDVESGHLRIGNRQHSVRFLLEKKRDYRASRTHDIPVAHHRKRHVMAPGIVVGSDEQFVRAKLGGAVKVDRRTSLVSR